MKGIISLRYLFQFTGWCLIPKRSIRNSLQAAKVFDVNVSCELFHQKLLQLAKEVFHIISLSQSAKARHHNLFINVV